MQSESMELHKKLSPKEISYSIIICSDSKYNKPEEDFSGEYLKKELIKKYSFKDKIIIKDDKEQLINSIEKMIDKGSDVILISGGTGLESRDITIETIEPLFDKKIEGFGEIFRNLSFQKLGSGALLSRATGGIYRKTVIFSMPGSPDAVKTGLKIIIDELPHLVNHTKR